MSIISLKEEIQHWKARALYAEGVVECFFQGSYPEGSDLTMIIVAQAGKKRNQEKASRAALLRGGVEI